MGLCRALVDVDRRLVLQEWHSKLSYGLAVLDRLQIPLRRFVQVIAGAQMDVSRLANAGRHVGDLDHNLGFASRRQQRHSAILFRHLLLTSTVPITTRIAEPIVGIQALRLILQRANHYSFMQVSDLCKEDVSHPHLPHLGYA